MTTAQVEPSTTSSTKPGGLSPAARRLLEMRLRGKAAAAPAGIPRLDPRPAQAPLSAAQQRLYFLDQLDPGGVEYLMPAAWRFTGPLDAAALGAAIGDLVARHEQLRVVFTHEDGVPAQHVLAAAEAPALDVVDLPPAVPGGGPEAVAEAVREVALRPFDLAAAPRSGPPCCGSRPRTTCSSWPCTTSSRTAGRWTS